MALQRDIIVSEAGYNVSLTPQGRDSHHRGPGLTGKRLSPLTTAAGIAKGFTDAFLRESGVGDDEGSFGELAGE